MDFIKLGASGFVSFFVLDFLLLLLPCTATTDEPNSNSAAHILWILIVFFGCSRCCFRITFERPTLTVASHTHWLTANVKLLMELTLCTPAYTMRGEQKRKERIRWTLSNEKRNIYMEKIEMWQMPFKFVFCAPSSNYNFNSFLFHLFDLDANATLHPIACTESIGKLCSTTASWKL